VPFIERPAVPVPPPTLLEGGNYRKFLADNRQRLEQCGGSADCEAALFNLGFVHAYPKSPYYNPSKAVEYFDELVQKYPNTSWAYTGRAWGALLRENLALEAKHRRLQTDLRSKEDAIRTKEDTIRNLRGQMERSRELDLRLDKKERELLR
jgi:hypothetical protein